MQLEEQIYDEISNGKNYFEVKDLANQYQTTENHISTIISNLKRENKIFGIRNDAGLGYFTYIQMQEGIAYNQLIKQGSTTDFKLITSYEGLIAYLRDSSRRLENRKGIDGYVYHYTNLRAVLSIIDSGFWFLNNPSNMNDGLEYKHAEPEVWKNIFFSSFMMEARESLAMWSMYAQPWESGVMVAIPINVFKNWVRNIDKVYKANPKTKQIDWSTYINREKLDLFISNIAYCNTDRLGEDNVEITTCGNASNYILRDVANAHELIGYVKNEAWSYEKEVRLRVDLKDNYELDGLSLPVPDEVINSMIVTKGPRFQGDLLSEFQNEINRIQHMKESLFFGKFRNIPCDFCKRS